MRVRCPDCGSDDVRPRWPTRLWERVAGFKGGIRRDIVLIASTKPPGAP